MKYKKFGDKGRGPLLFKWQRDDVDVWVWCLHCECVHLHKAGTTWDYECPNPGCDGNLIDFESWDKARRPEYPQVPKEGWYYPVYVGNKNAGESRAPQRSS